MRILVAGDWHSTVHEEPVYRALTGLGHTVERFAWHPYFEPHGPAQALTRLALKAQNKYLFGPSLAALNRNLLAMAKQFCPDCVLVYRGTHVTRTTLRALKQTLPATCLVGYNNDDPFAPNQPRWLWRHFMAAVPEYDLLLAYRQHNLADLKLVGARQVQLFRSWFVPEVHHPVSLSSEDRQRFESDVVFVGHYEPDGRLELLEEITRQGWQLRLFGPGRGYRWQGWYPVIEQSATLQHLLPINLVRGEDYNKALCGAKVALCFLSKLNRDTYTRRCFEIPATRTFMLSEYSDDLAGLYRAGNEADFFRSQDELIEKLRYYLAHDEERKAAAAAGYRRVYADGHDVASRMRQLLSWVTKWQQENRQ